MQKPEPDPIPALKEQLAKAVVEALAGWEQWHAGHIIGVDGPRMSNLRRGQLKRFSLAQLVRFVSRAGGDVGVTVTWTPRQRIFRWGTATYVADPEVARARTEKLRAIRGPAGAAALARAERAAAAVVAAAAAAARPVRK